MSFIYWILHVPFVLTRIYDYHVNRSFTHPYVRPNSFEAHYDPNDDYEDSSFEFHALNDELALQRLNNTGDMTHRVHHLHNHSHHHFDHHEHPKIELKFTNLSKEAHAQKYRKQLTNSKIFEFYSPFTIKVNIILVSTTKNYHPQLIISEKWENKYEEVLYDKNNFSFYTSIGKHYVLEVGHKRETITAPFEDISDGSFILILTTVANSISDMMIQEAIKVGLKGYEGVVPFENGAPLELYHPERKFVNHGFLNYEITPFFNSQKESITLYYHQGIDSFIGDRKRSSTLEIICNDSMKDLKTFVGSEASTAKYEYTVESSRICAIIDQVK